MSDKKKKILIVRLSSLGDVIFTVPLANLFKRNGYEVGWVVSEKVSTLLKITLLLIKFILHRFKSGKKEGFLLKVLENLLKLLKK